MGSLPPGVYDLEDRPRRRLRPGRREGKTSLPYITKDGLKYLLLEEAADTDVKRSEKVMVERIFDFSEASAGRVMVPISNVAALEDEATFGDAARLINETGFSRLPVYGGDIINIVGVVNAFDILKQLPASAAQPVRSALRQLLYVPASKPADDLLLEMQKRGEPMAVVVDEYGGAVGIVTIEDILEEIVGDIRDEYDKRERAVRKLGPGQYLVSAHIGIVRLREIVPVSIPEGPYETLAGYLLHQMGRIPRRMEQFRAGNVKFVIEDADMKSIKQVQIILPAEPSAAQKEEGQAESQRPVTGLLTVAVRNLQPVEKNDKERVTMSTEDKSFATLILAAGKGTRMKSDLVKVLHPVAGRPMLDYVLNLAEQMGSSRIAVIIGHQAELVEARYGNRGLAFVYQREQLGTGHAVLQAAEAFAGYRGTILILCGDVPLLRASTHPRPDGAPPRLRCGHHGADDPSRGPLRLRPDRQGRRGKRAGDRGAPRRHGRAAKDPRDQHGDLLRREPVPLRGGE